MTYLLRCTLSICFLFTAFLSSAQDYDKQPWRRYSGQVKAYTERELDTQNNKVYHYLSSDTMDAKGNVTAEFRSAVYVRQGDTSYKEHIYTRTTYDKAGKMRWRTIYTDDGEQVKRDSLWWAYDAKGRTAEVKTISHLANGEVERSGVTTTYNDAKHTDTALYYDVVNGNNVPDFIVVAIRNKKERAIEEWHLDKDGSKGFESHTLNTYHSNGELKERITYDPDGKVHWQDRYVINKYGIAETVYHRYKDEIEELTNTYDQFDEHKNYRRHIAKSEKGTSVTEIDIVYR